MDKNSYAIVGGGIGGLTLAVALQQKGFSVTVYENAPEWKPLGAGLALAGNAVKAFREIGIEKEILQAGKVIKKFLIKDQKGKTLVATNSEKISSKYGAVNNFAIHRADLHAVLLEKLNPGTVQLNKGCIGFTQNENGVDLLFHDGSHAKTDYVIACDGIHSVFRKKLIPDSVRRYAGYTCWRAVVDNLPSDFNFDETSETWGQGCRFGIVPLAQKRVYWFACVNGQQNDTVLKSLSPTDLLLYFGKFHKPIPEILERTKPDQMIWSDIIDLKPIKQFAFGNIVLMGDAAHATTPNMGQGACQAIEDAVVLANCMEISPKREEAFRLFEQKRIGRTTKVVNDSWQLGRIAQLDNAFLSTLRNFALRLTPPSVTENQIKFIYDVSFR